MQRLLRYNTASITCVVIMLNLTLCGCIERAFSVKSSNPDKSYAVYIEGMYVGDTPYKADFVFYGTHEIMIRDSSGRTRVLDAVLKRPWYQYFPLDFFSELLFPCTAKSEFVFTVDILEENKVDLTEIERKAGEFREYYKKLYNENK